ncbi:MAG: CNNM domain-containing protein [Rickettsiales bacterium]|jgi:Mg2+/Co2+ transporter CorB|nr:CNNM domain-containing protein [Rickettsiales bacterium]
MLELFIISISIIVPLSLSCILSASETAVTAMSGAKIHKLKKDGNKRARIISKLKEDREGLISTILLANNTCNILASTMSAAFLIKIFGGEGIIYSTVIMTALIIVFAEVLPKTYAIAHPEKLALKFAYFLKITVTICKPITGMINKFVSIFKISPNYDDNLVSPTDEIKGAIDLHHRQGRFDQDNKYMLDGVFFLEETNVSEVMTHRKNIESINIDLGIKEILAQVKESGYTRIPMWKDNPDNIVGVLNTRELLDTLLDGQKLNKININDLIVEPIFVHENTTLGEQLSNFKERKIRFAMVIDEYGDIQGLITLADILEEVIGSVQEEGDDEVILKDGACVVKGEVTIRDLNRALDWHLPDEDASTIAGLVIHEAERIPEVGEEFKFYKFYFTILSKNGNQLTSIKVKKV